jgi:hypothetical protein
VLPDASARLQTGVPDLAGFHCSFDGAAFTSCASTGATYNNLSEGQHDFRVRAFDTVGNFDPTPASRRFTVVFESHPPPPPPAEEPPQEPKDPQGVLGGREERPATAAAPGDPLPATGLDVSTWLLWGLALILMGCVPLAVRRPDEAAVEVRDP